MADNGFEEGDQPMDKAARNREIDNLSFDQEAFEILEKEFQQFLQEIIGDKDLEKFRSEYELTYNTLVNSYSTEKDLIKRCKDFNNRIFEKATSVRAAIRMASSEMDKINSLKSKVTKAYEEVARQKAKEENAK